MTAAVIVGVACVAGVVAAPAIAAAEPAPASPAETADARALVMRWRDAQNQGDWPAYQALYAPTFTGVRRVGAKATRFDRAGWLKDRKAMFKAAMTVDATNLVVTADGVMLIVELDQRWSQGLYADVGRKRMTISVTDGLITSEELLDSRPILTVPACLRAVYPTGKRGRTGPARTDDVIGHVTIAPIGDRFACAIEHAARGDTTKDIDLVGVRRAKGWVVTGKVTHTVTALPGGTFGQDGGLELEAFPLGARTGLVAALTETEYDDTHRNTKTRAALYLVGDAALTEVLAWESVSGSDVEDTEATDCTIAVRGGEHGGMPDLERSCTRTWGDWWNEDPAERGPKEATETASLVWDGAAYVEP